MALLLVEDPVEAAAMQAIAERTWELGRLRDQELAIRIANAVGQSFSGK